MSTFGSDGPKYCYFETAACVRVWALCVALIGFVATAHIAQMTNYESFDVLVHIIDDESHHRKGALPFFGYSTRYMNVFAIVMCSFMAVVGCLGYLGGITESLSRVSVYIFGNCVVFAFFISVVHWCIIEVPKINSLVDGEVSKWCHPGLTLQYMKGLGCSGSIYQQLHAQDLTCDSDCQRTIKILTELKQDRHKFNGCNYLDRICHDFSFDIVGKGRCITRVGQNGVSRRAPSMKSTTKEDGLCCKLACDSYPSCKGYMITHDHETDDQHGGFVLSGYCELVTPKPLVKNPIEVEPTIQPENTSALGAAAEPHVQHERKRKHKLGQEERDRAAKLCSETLEFSDSRLDWPFDKPPVVVRGDASERSRCFRKGFPTVVEETHTSNVMSAILAGGALVTLFFGTVSACCFQSKLVLKRNPNLQSFSAKLGTMLCPCWTRTPDRPVWKPLMWLESTDSDDS